MSDIIKLDGVSFGYADPETEQKTKIFDNLSLSISVTTARENPPFPVF